MTPKAQAKPANGPRAFIIDDDGEVREAMAFLLRSRGVAVALFESAEAFLEQFDLTLRGCILTDVRMGGMSGLELTGKLAALSSRLPVIVLTGHGDVAMAVETIKSGVRDFVEKPFNTNSLADKIIAAIADDEMAANTQLWRNDYDRRLAMLSERECEIMGLLVAGKLNKVIADELNIAMRTVEVHRSRIFARMGVRNAVELANLVSQRRS